VAGVADAAVLVEAAEASVAAAEAVCRPSEGGVMNDLGERDVNVTWVVRHGWPHFGSKGGQCVPFLRAFKAALRRLANHLIDRRSRYVP
jgi:hypothetical protein